MKCKRIIQRLTTGVVTFIMMLSLCVSAMAEGGVNETGNDLINAAKNAIVEIEVYYKPTNKEAELVQTGTGFLINKQTLITNNHVIKIDEAGQNYLKELYHQKFDPDAVSIQLISRADIRVTATVIASSAMYDYAILKVPENSLNTRTTLKLGDSQTAKQAQRVYALGFPYSISASQKVTNHAPYSTDDVTITTGEISKVGVKLNTTEMEAKFIQHLAKLKEGNSGGPLIDENANVIGVNTAEQDGFYYAIEVEEIKATLADKGIEYESADSTSYEPASMYEPESSDDISVPESSDAVLESKPEAKPVGGFIDSDIDLDNDNDDGMSATTIILIVVAAVVVIVLIALIIIFATKGSKDNNNNNNASVSTSGGFVPPQPPQYPDDPATMPIDVGGGETTLLNEGGETSVLSGGMTASRAMLVRRKNGTNFTINKAEYVIGKQRNRVDCCINNNAISRQHAKISCNGGIYYITDMGSSNYTYVNGVQISPNVATVINNGDIIQLADEEFEFKG